MVESKRSHLFPGGQTLEITQGDITSENVDAIVNAANEYLAHGGGVAAAIVRRGGEVIQEESDAWVKQHGPVMHAKPAYTHAGRLPCRYVIHAIGPIWGSGQEDEKLATAITGCLSLAEELQLESISFPAISTGIFGFPKERAAEIFMRTIGGFFKKNVKSKLKLIRITINDQATYDVFLKAFHHFFS